VALGPRIGQAAAPALPGKTAVVGVLAIAGAIGAGAAWVGFSTGARESGILSLLGYGFGILGVVESAVSVLGIGGVLLGYEALQKAAAERAP
jgi:hypothetical protein